MNSEFVTLSDRGGVRFYTDAERVYRLGAKWETNKSYLVINAVRIVRVALSDVLKTVCIILKSTRLFSGDGYS